MRQAYAEDATSEVDLKSKSRWSAQLYGLCRCLSLSRAAAAAATHEHRYHQVQENNYFLSPTNVPPINALSRT